MDTQTNVVAWRPNGWREDVFLDVTVWYGTSPPRRARFTTDFEIYDSVEAQIEAAIRSTTEYIRRTWFRIEVCVPNRDARGNIQPGYMHETGVLLVTRSDRSVSPNKELSK